MADLSRFPPWPGDRPSRDNLARVNDELWERHTRARTRLRDEHGIVVTVASAWRDTAQQRVLYDCYIRRTQTGKCPCASCNLAAPPGSSNHERGLALDLSPGPRSIKVAREIYYAEGIHFPVVPEDWHAEMYANRPPIPHHPPPPPVVEVPTMHTVRNHDGRLEEFDVFWTRVVHRWQESDLKTWHEWESLPPLPQGDMAADCSVCRTHDGRLEVTARAGGGLRYRCWQKTPGGPFDVWVPA